MAELNTPSESVSFDVIRSNCFSIRRHLLHFRPYPTPQVEVREWPEPDQAKWSLLRRILPAGPQPVATVALTPRGVQGLDQLLQFYRSGQVGGCTRRELIVVSRSVYGWKLRSETYWDDSCQVDLLADADGRDLGALGKRSSPVVSMDRLIDTAEAARQRGLRYVTYTPAPRSQTAAYRELQYRRQIKADRPFTEQEIFGR